MMEIKRIALQDNSDNRGSLFVAESLKNIPFEIKRVYFFNGKNNISRGYHAHQLLQQVAICLSGSCEFILDNGKERQSVLLEAESPGLYIGDFLWREIKNFSKDCVVAVLASHWYDENDYIRDYEEYKKQVQKNESC